MEDIIIIDPASTEFNRGSFCYLPYIYYSALKKQGKKVKILENFTVADIDSIPEAHKYLISVWSYPQIDTALVLDRFMCKNVKFFGYYELLRSLDLPIEKVSEEDILDGIESYMSYMGDFKYILLSDCDMHLKEYDGQVYPLFTSYGCPNGCSFCPSTANCDRKRLTLPVETAIEILDQCHAHDMKNIHFTDEDFFFDINRAYGILESQVGKDMNFIALGSAVKVMRFVRKYGEEILHQAGVRLIEIGLESADSDLTDSMNKTGADACLWLAENVSIPIFWLTMTFFPGETISSLNKTGEFLKRYGHKTEDLYDRVKTNSTKGGLGQFFQIYHGTDTFDEKEKLGVEISDRPIRLLPSFVPVSFLHSKVEKLNPIKKEDEEWFQLYKLWPGYLELTEGLTVMEHITEHKELSLDKTITYLAICARLGVIE